MKSSLNKILLVVVCILLALLRFFKLNSDRKIEALASDPWLWLIIIVPIILLAFMYFKTFIGKKRSDPSNIELSDIIAMENDPEVQKRRLEKLMENAEKRRIEEIQIEKLGFQKLDAELEMNKKGSCQRKEV